MVNGYARMMPKVEDVVHSPLGPNSKVEFEHYLQKKYGRPSGLAPSEYF